MMPRTKPRALHTKKQFHYLSSTTCLVALLGMLEGASPAHAQAVKDTRYGATLNAAKLQQVGTPTALSRGYAGAKIQIGIIDSGVDFRQVDLQGRNSLPYSRNFSADATAKTINDPSPVWGNNPGVSINNKFSGYSHGTEVAGVASYIAPNADILGYRVAATGGGGGIDGKAAVNAVNYAANYADVINMSFGSSVGLSLRTSAVQTLYFNAPGSDSLFKQVSDITALASAVSKAVGTVGTLNKTPTLLRTTNRGGYADKPVAVFAAGNDGWNSETGQVSVQIYNGSAYAGTGTVKASSLAAAMGVSANMPSLQARMVELSSNKFPAGSVIVAVSVDANNKISNFSNGCGITKSHCLAAPGENWSAPIPLDAAKNAGLAPSVGNYWAGASGTSFAAPTVSGAVAVLMSSFPNLKSEQVTSILFTTAKDLGAAGVDDVYGRGLLDLNKATQPVGTIAVLTPTKTVALPSFKTSSAFGAGVKAKGSFGFVDEYQRAYTTDASAMVASLGKQQSLMHDDARQELFGQIVGSAPQFAGAPIGAWTSVTAFRQEASVPGLARISLNVEDMHGQRGGGLSPITGLQAGNLESVSGMSLVPNALENQNLRRFGFGTALNGDTTLRMSVGFSDGVFSQDEQTTLEGGAPVAYSQDVEIRRNLSKATWFSLSGGMLTEHDTVLGSYFGGAASTDKARTLYQVASAGTALSPNTALVGGFGYAMTDVHSTGGAHFDTLKSTSMTLGLVGNEALEDGDRWTLSYREPLRVGSGSAHLDQATGYDENGDYTFGTQRYDLTSDGHEQTVEAFYGLEPGLAGEIDTVGMVLGYSKDYGNVAGQNNTYGMLRYALRF